MSTIMRHCVASGLLFCSLLGFWFMGVVPSFDMIIGIFLLLGFVAITNYIKPARIGRVAILFYTALILFIALNAVYSLVPESIREELGLIRGSETIKTAEQLHQPGGKTLQVIREQCKADFDKSLKEAVDKLHQSASPNKTEKLIEDVRKLEEHRQKCSDAILALGEKGAVGKTSQEINLQDMHEYILDSWYYTGSRQVNGTRWLSWNYKFTNNGFLIEEAAKPSQYKLLSRSMLQLTQWDQTEEKYRIMIIDHNTMQLIFQPSWLQRLAQGSFEVILHRGIYK